MNGLSPAVSVVVPTRDRPDQLARCLAALAQQSASSYEIVVLDDGSQVDQAAAIAAAVADEPRARLLSTGGRGPAAARNAGARAARGTIVCFTDDDCEPGPAWIDVLSRGIYGGEQAAAGPTVNARPGSVCTTASQEIVNHLTETTLDPETGRIGFVPSCNLACRADVIRDMPFDERFPLAAGEDRDWCARLAEGGGGIAFLGEAWVEHRPSLTLPGYWAQQVRYGRGAWRFRRAAPGRPGLAPLRFYSSLLRRGLAHGPRVGLLVCLAQLATALGILAEALCDLRARVGRTAPGCTDRRGG